jgi:riboflavin kinase/FMN adenylyltransferase
MDEIVISLDELKVFQDPCVLAIGMFDGLHIGHLQVIAKAKELAEKYNAKLSVLTFSPHPSQVINMGRAPVEMLFQPDVRAKMFKDAGIEFVFVKNFDVDFAEKSSDDFQIFLQEKFPNLKGIVTGENFLYGKNAKGNPQTLTEMANRSGWEYSAVKGVYLDDQRRMSSSLMRQALKSADLQLFEKIAGYPYTAQGIVSSGRKLGRTIGFPTLNLKWNPECKPPFGVYSVELTFNNKKYLGIANYGTNPTVAETSPTLETHLFDDNITFGEGTYISVSLKKFIRPQKKFNSIQELKQQISQDFLLHGHRQAID